MRTLSKYFSHVSSFFSSRNLSGRRLDVYHTCTHGGPSANLECRSEMWCMRLAANAGPKSRQISPSGHHRTNLSGYIFATKAHIDNRKEIVKQQYLIHTSSEYSELRLTIG